MDMPPLARQILLGFGECRTVFIETTPRSLTRRYFLDSEGLQRVCVKACGYAKAMVDLIERECSPYIRAEEPIDHAVVVS
jgi:hypothetical protein